jgi:hypothetical protein
MNRYKGPHPSPAIALDSGLYLAIIMNRYGGPKTSLTIAVIETST